MEDPTFTSSPPVVTSLPKVGPMVTSSVVSGPSRATMSAPGEMGALGFAKASDTPFDDALSKLSDAAQVVLCQLVDEIIRDLQSSVSHYKIPPRASCAQFYAWLDNQAATTIGRYLDGYQRMLGELGLGALPDNMGTQMTALRDGIISVMRAAMDPVCSNPDTPELTKQLVQERLKATQGMLCAMQPRRSTAGEFPKVVKDPVTGVSTIVTADGNSVKLNLDNSADNSNNIANSGGNGGGGGGKSGGLDPNVLAALLLANSQGGTAAPVTDTPVPSVNPGIVGMDTTLTPAAMTDPITAALDSGLFDTPAPTAPPVPTLLGLGPIGLFMVFGLVIAIGFLVWQLSQGGAAAAGAVAAPVGPPSYPGMNMGMGMGGGGMGGGGFPPGANPFS